MIAYYVFAGLAGLTVIGWLAFFLTDRMEQRQCQR